MNHTVILIAEDTEERTALVNILQDGNYTILNCWNVPELLTAAYFNTPAVVIVDANFNSNIIDASLQIHNDMRTKDVPIIFLLPSQPDVPMFATHFRSDKIGFLTYPYGTGEIVAILKAIDSKSVNV